MPAPPRSSLLRSKTLSNFSSEAQLSTELQTPLRPVDGISKIVMLLSRTFLPCHEDGTAKPLLGRYSAKSTSRKRTLPATKCTDLPDPFAWLNPPQWRPWKFQVHASRVLYRGTQQYIDVTLSLTSGASLRCTVASGDIAFRLYHGSRHGSSRGIDTVNIA